MRVDGETKFSSVELLNGIVEKADPERPFVLARLVGDLGYAGVLVVTDGERVIPLTSVAKLSAAEVRQASVARRM